MPRYTFEGPGGHKVTVEGDAPPTDQDLDGIFASAGLHGAPMTHKLPTDEQIASSVRPKSGGLETAVGTALTGGVGALLPTIGAPSDIVQQIGRGGVDESGKLALGAREMVDRARAKMSPQTAQYDPGDYAQIRKQLEPQTTGENVGQLGVSGLTAMALGGAPGGVTLGTGLATGLESGDPVMGAKAGLASAVLGPVTGKLAQYGAGLKFSQAKAIIKALKVGAGALSGELIAGHRGGLAGALAAAVIPSMPTTSKRKLYDYINNDQINEATRLLWKYLPPIVAHETADTETKPQPTEGYTGEVSAADMLAEAKRRKAANAVLR